MELKNLFGKLTMDVIICCAFATRVDAYNEEKTDPFIQSAQNLLRPAPKTIISFLLLRKFPQLSKLGLKIFASKDLEIFRSVVSLE